MTTTVRVALDERPDLIAQATVAPGGDLLGGSLIKTAAGAIAKPAELAVPTQVANPSRTTWRSIFQLLVALAVALPQIVPIATGVIGTEWILTTGAQVLAVHAAVVRVMALKPVNDWLLEHVPALAAIPSRVVEAA